MASRRRPFCRTILTLTSSLGRSGRLQRPRQLLAAAPSWSQQRHQQQISRTVTISAAAAAAAIAVAAARNRANEFLHLFKIKIDLGQRHCYTVYKHVDFVRSAVRLAAVVAVVLFHRSCGNVGTAYNAKELECHRTRTAFWFVVIVVFLYVCLCVFVKPNQTNLFI